MKRFAFILPVALFLGLVACDTGPPTPEEAIPQYLAILRLDPVNVDTHYKLARLYLLAGNLKEGISHLKDVVRLDKRHAAAYRDLGWACFQKRELLKAEKWLTRALELSPLDTRTITDLAGIYLALDRPEQAVELLKTVAFPDQTRVEIWNNLAAAYRESGQPGKAIEAMERALTLNAESAETLNNLAVLFEDLGMPRNAWQVYHAALEYNPHHAVLRFNLGAAYARSRNYQAAEYHLLEAARLNPRDPRNQAGLGRVYRKQKQFSKAIRHFQKALRLDASKAQVHYELAEIFDLTRQYSRAEDSYLTAINLSPRRPEIYYDLAVLYDHLKEERKALVYMTLAGNLYGDRKNSRMEDHCRRNVQLFIKKHNLDLKDLGNLLRQEAA